MKFICTRVLTWVKSKFPYRTNIRKSDTVAETGWDLLPFSFAVDFFGPSGQKDAPPVAARTPVSVEAMSRLNALWEAQNWSTGGELHLSLDEYRTGIRAWASNSSRFKEDAVDDAVDFYVRRTTRERSVPPCGETDGSSKL